MNPEPKEKYLGDICDILDSKRKPVTKRDRVSGKYPYYGASGILDYVNDYLFDEKLVLIGEDGAKWEQGKKSAFIAEGKYWVNNHAHVIRPNRSIVIDEWIVYFLNFSDLTKYTTGLTVPKLNQERLRSIEIPVPPIPEQQRIVEILDQSFAAIDQAIENTEKNIQKSQELINNYTEVIFSPASELKSKKLGEVLKLEYGKPLPPDKRSTDGEHPVYGANGIKDHTNIFYFDQPSIIIGRKGSAGEVTLTSEKFWPLDVTYFIVFDQLKYSLKFLFYLLKNLKLQKLAKGVKPGINRNDVYALEAYFPPLIEQQHIAGILDNLHEQTQHLVSTYKDKISLLQELKQSILHKAFKGEL